MVLRMRFVRLSAEAYASFTARQPRLFVPQMPEYAAVRRCTGSPVEYVGVVEGQDRESEHVIGAGLLYIQPWKKLFQRALINYGPTLDWTNSELITTFFEGLTSLLRSKYPRVLALQICPLVAKNHYQDIYVTRPSQTGTRTHEHLTRLGFSHVDAEFYECPEIQIRYIYTKSIAGMTFEEATASLKKGLRRRFHNEGRYGVQVRFLGPDEFDVFEQLHESTAERTEMEDMSRASQKLYRGLMEQLGPDRAFLCVAFFNPARYIDEIDQESRELAERITTLEARKQTKARDRELAQGEKRKDILAANLASAREALQTWGDREIPINSILSFLSGRELILLLGGMDKRFREYARDYPVERAMFKLACDKGLDIYNTFGITGDFSEDAIDAPVLAFKRWLNGNVEEFIGTYNKPLFGPLSRALGAS